MDSPRTLRALRRLLALAALLPAVVLAGEVREVRLGGQTFRLPDGFEIERVAGPPLVDRPITVAFDELGRLYAADSAGVNDDVRKQLETKPHRIVRLEDLDGDGVFDRSIVFADRMMFPEGTLWYDGSLYVAAPPSIWKLTDTDGDGVSDRREKWFEGKTLTGCANDLHGPYLGLDGRIYWCKGAFARQTYERPGRPPFVTRAAHIFRSRPDGSEIEPVLTGGMDNPIDVVMTGGGERILTTTFFRHPGGGKRDGLIHAIYGGVYGKVHGVIDEHPRTGEDVMPVLAHLGPAAPCGLEIYRSAVFGDDFRENLFAALFNLHKVTRHVLEPEGATFRTTDSDFVVSDSRDFHPTDVIEDADGSLLVVDTGGWYKLCCPTSQLYKPDVLGAIYRVRRKDAPGFENPRGLDLDWESIRAAEVAALLGDPRPAVRERARARLATEAAGAVRALAPFLDGSAPAEARLDAVWALARIDEPEARAAIREALDDPDATVLRAAIHAAGLWRDAGAAERLAAMLESGAAPVRRSAAEALGRIGDPAAVAPLLAASAEPLDRTLEHSLTYALIEIAASRATARGLEHPSPRSRRAALIALDQMRDGASELRPGKTAEFLASKDASLRQAAAWVIGGHPEWAEEIGGTLVRRLRTGDTPEVGRREIIEVLGRLAKHAPVAQALTETLDDPAVGVETRRRVLRAMHRSPVEKAPAGWIDAIARVVRSKDAALLPEALRAARSLELPQGSAEESAGVLRAALLALAREPSNGKELRLRALGALPPASALGSDLLAFALDFIDPGAPATLQSAAADVLARARLDREGLEEVAARMRRAGPLVLTKLLEAFEEISDEAFALDVLDALEGSPGIAGLRPDALARWLEKRSPPVKERGAKLIASLEEDTAEKRARLDEIAATLPEGDVRRGQEVFNSPEAACAACHAIGYLGGTSGPDLTRIGTVRSRRDLLESLVYPSASFVRSYEPVVVVTTEGDVLGGVVRSDSADEIVLATGPGEEVRIARRLIADMQRGKTSIMPGGLTDLLTRQELADLLAFLMATRW